MFPQRLTILGWMPKAVIRVFNTQNEMLIYERLHFQGENLVSSVHCHHGVTHFFAAFIS